VGGVLAPVNAAPVIIEDDVVVGGNCGVYEGTVVRSRAVLAAGTVLTRGTPVFDLVNETVLRGSPDSPLEIPSGAVVVPGARAVTTGWGKELVAADTGDREVPRRADRSFHGVGVMAPMTVGRVRLVVRGEVRVPGDKSVSHRALMFGSLAHGVSSVRGILQSADTESTAGALRSLGWNVPALGPEMTVEGSGLTPVDLHRRREPEQAPHAACRDAAHRDGRAHRVRAG
jgi:hypothetical protein